MLCFCHVFNACAKQFEITSREIFDCAKMPACAYNNSAYQLRARRAKKRSPSAVVKVKSGPKKKIRPPLDTPLKKYKNASPLS